MHGKARIFVVAATLGALVWSGSIAQTRADCEKVYRPETGQAGKDVIWVPTNDALVERMLRLANTTATDVVYDLGAGDGKIAIAAAKRFGATSVGVEYDPDMAKFAQCLVKAEGVAGKTRVIQGDIFATDFSSATVVTLYLLPELNLRLRPTILQMKPGTRVVSHSFLMDDWEPDDRSMTEDGSAYLWIVPARVNGVWTFTPQAGGERLVAQLDQAFQVIKGSVVTNDGTHPFAQGKVDGANVTLTFVRNGKTYEFKGVADGDRMSATLTEGNTQTRYVGSKS